MSITTLLMRGRMTNTNLNNPRTLWFDAVVSDRILFTEPEINPTKYHAFVWAPDKLRFVWHEETDIMGQRAKIIHYEQHTAHPTLAIHVDHSELANNRLYNGFKSWLTTAGAKV